MATTPARRRLSGRMSFGGGRMSFGGSSTRTGRTSVGTDLGINDDEAEKRRRRARRKSFGAPLARTPAGGDGPTNAQIATMYQTALKLSTENKINQKNTWSLSLIDHIGELCSGQQSDKGPDFQKASCTLDASVKIYSYRVDDVWTSSFRVLENLNRTGKHQSAAAAAAGNKGASKKLHVAATLEKNIASITVKKFDMEFDVDPLFHKMSKAFDEGGARGMLLNHLGVHDGCAIVFDSVDVGDVDSEAVDAPAADEEDVPGFDAAPLRTQLAASCEGGDLGAIARKSLCPSLTWLRGELSRAQRALAGVTNDADQSGGEAPGACEAKGSFADAPDYSDDDDIYEGGGFTLADFHDEPVDAFGGDAGRQSVGSAAGAAWAPRRSSEDGSRSINAAATLCDAVALSTPANAEYCYFDTARLSKLHHWAGPSHSHWKPGRTATTSTSGTAAAKASGRKGAKKPKKAKFTIDFLGDPVDTATAFAPPPRSATATQMSAAALRKAVEGAESLLLPEDHGYKLGDLMKLSCKRGKVVVMAPGVAGALAATDGARGAEAVAVGVLDGEPDDAAFRFQGGDHDGAGDAYNDDYDSDGGEGGGFMLAGDESVAGSGDGVVPVSHDFQGLLVDKAERVEKIDIAYAKVAKKVDVKKLKENIWTYVSRDGADSARGVPASAGATQALATGGEAAAEDTPVDGVSFQATVAALAPTAPSSITVPFYFICMLHLANEKGLALHPAEDLSDFRVSTVTGSEDCEQ